MHFYEGSLRSPTINRALSVNSHHPLLQQAPQPQSLGASGLVADLRTSVGWGQKPGYHVMPPVDPLQISLGVGVGVRGWGVGLVLTGVISLDPLANCWW